MLFAAVRCRSLARRVIRRDARNIVQCGERNFVVESHLMRDTVHRQGPKLPSRLAASQLPEVGRIEGLEIIVAGTAPQSGHRRALVTVSRGKATFRKSDVERGIKALENAGLKVARVEISREGNITLIPEDDSTATTNENQDLRDLV
jgi:hypothetical protein